jgi:hypothetical protein
MLATMMIRRIGFDLIRLADDTYRISEELEPPSLLVSLREIGQLNPIVLMEDSGSSYKIVCGFRRLRALQALGAHSASAQVLPTQYTPAQMFSIALFDNLAQRELDPLEIARALHGLKETCGVSEEELTAKYLPVLGFKQSSKTLQRFLSVHAAEPVLRALFKEKALTLASIETLAEMDLPAQAAFGAIMRRIRLSATLQRQVLELAEELAGASRSALSEVFSRPELVSILNQEGLSTFQRGERVRDTLHRLRYPRLSAAATKFEKTKESLRLKGAISVSSDPFFEKPGIKLEFQSATAKSFIETVSILNAASQSPLLDALFKVT